MTKAATVRRSEIRARLDRSRGDLDAVATRSPDLLDTLDRFQGGGFAPRGDTGCSGAGGCSSPVEAALSAPDAALVARQRYERLLRQLNDTIADLSALHRQWLAGQQTGTIQSGCVVMRQVGVWEAATLTDANGTLPGRLMLSRWAREFAIRHGRLPHRPEAERRAQGADIRVAV